MEQLPGLIVGGGIAGLTAALALRQRGLAAAVVEAAPQILPLGAGIWLAPNAMQVLDRLGLAARVQAAGQPLRGLEIVDAQLRPILRTDQARVRRRFGFGTTAIHRATLQALLLEELGPAHVQLGRVVTGVTPGPASATVCFADGRRQAAGYVVGADGIHSPLREQLFPGLPPADTGYLVWRGMARLALPAPLQAAIREAWGQGRRFGFSEVAPGVVDWFAAVPASFGSQREELTGRLLAAFAGFAAPVAALLAATPAAAVIGTMVLARPPLLRWHRGRVGLIGDAAHPTTPYLGQGGCQAIEDAWVLAQALARHPADPAAAFAELERLRCAQARYVARLSRLLGHVGYWRGPAAALRNALIRAAPRWLTERQFGQVYALGY